MFTIKPNPLGEPDENHHSNQQPSQNRNVKLPEGHKQTENHNSLKGRTPHVPSASQR